MHPVAHIMRMDQLVREDALQKSGPLWCALVATKTAKALTLSSLVTEHYRAFSLVVPDM
jgi:hypothetical protein